MQTHTPTKAWISRLVGLVAETGLQLSRHFKNKAPRKRAKGIVRARRTCASEPSRKESHSPPDQCVNSNSAGELMAIEILLDSVHPHVCLVDRCLI
jgi:hypothetical protein